MNICCNKLFIIVVFLYHNELICKMKTEKFILHFNSIMVKQLLLSIFQYGVSAVCAILYLILS